MEYQNYRSLFRATPWAVILIEHDNAINFMPLDNQSIAGLRDS